MRSETFNFLNEENKKIFVYRWLPDEGQKIKAVIHIIHGMGEHAGRYEEFANILADNGFAVYAMDQHGHGKTAENPECFGHFDDKQGWEKVTRDLIALTERINEEFPDLGIFLFGHSSGSFLARDYILLSKRSVKGIILSSTAASPGIPGLFGILVAKYLIKRYGPEAKSPLHLKLTFCAYNSNFKPARTESDWISRDNIRVDAMLKDPYCYRGFSAAFYLDLIRALFRINRFKNILKIPKDLPVLFISGTADALGGFKKGVNKVYTDFKKAGISDLQLKFYEGARHELVNETCRTEVFDDVKEWLNKRI